MITIPVVEPTPQFDQFHSSSNTVLNGTHKLSHALVVKAASPGGNALEYGAISDSPIAPVTPLTGYIVYNFAGPKLSFSSTCYTDGRGDKVTVTPNILPYGESISFTAATRDVSSGFKGPFGTVETSIFRTNLAASAKASTDLSATTLDVSASTAAPFPRQFPGVSLGAKMGVSHAAGVMNFTAAELGLQWRHARYTAAVTTSNNLKTINASWTGLVTPETQLSGSLQTPFSCFKAAAGATEPRQFTVGAQHYSAGLGSTLKLKAVLPDNTVSACVEKRIVGLNLPSGKLGFSIRCSAANGLSKVERYGFTYTIGDLY